MNWEKWISEGDQYFNGASGKDGKPSKFSGAIRYNLVSLALESYVMAILDYHTKLPENHTFSDLVDAMQTVVPIPPQLRKRILSHEDAQSICSIEAYHRHEPPAHEIDDLQGAIKEIRKMAHGICIAKPFAGLPDRDQLRTAEQ